MSAIPKERAKARRGKTGHAARPGADDPRPSGTPYDDVFKTMLVHCSHLLLFLLNELFGEHYIGDEEVIHGNSEHFTTDTKGRQRKRITDGHFIVRSGWGERTYLIECQTEPDGTILIRICEYAMHVALERATMEGDTLRVGFPKVAIIALRSRKDAPRKRKIEVSFPSGEAVSYEVPVLNVKDLTSDDIFEKDLLALLPFWLFAHEARFDAIEEDEGELEALLGEQARVLERLGERVRGEDLTERDGLLILEMMRKVGDAIAAKHGKVREELKKVMGGTAFLPETVKMYDQVWEKGMIRGRREGIALGRSEGIALGEKRGILATAWRMKLGGLEAAQIAAFTGLSLAEIEALQGDETEEPS